VEKCLKILHEAILAGFELAVVTDVALYIVDLLANEEVALAVYYCSLHSTNFLIANIKKSFREMRASQESLLELYFPTLPTK